jgi:eukaryotic-like serine/threonine-protein kinase
MIDAARARVFDIFQRALELEPDARVAFVDAECAGDAELRSEVEALLAVASADGASTAAMRIRVSAIPIPENIDLSGEEFGHFRLVEKIGAGGSGVVYRAERTDGVTQSVAIKVLGGQIAAGALSRLQREAKLLARLEHPSVARLIDAGEHSGRAWIAIEYIRGQPIDRYCDDNNLSLRERVRLLLQVASAVAAAHQVLIVHRDIKPSNVLVDEKGYPKLIDFGIATNLDAAGSPGELTVDLSSMFTPHYAAPEQVLRQTITVATDVFGLGALAHCLLAGRAPYADADGPVRYAIAITRREADPPSVVAVRAGRGKHVVRGLKGDLDAIVQKAMALSVARRYPTAAEFAADLQRYLENRPVLAGSPSVAYRMGKFVRRHTLSVVTASLLVIGAAVAGVIYVSQLRTIASTQAIAAERGRFLQNMLQSADPRGGKRDVTVAELLDAAVAKSDTDLAREPLTAASMLGLIAQTDYGLGRYPRGLDASERQLRLLRANGAPAKDLAEADILNGLLLWRSQKLDAGVAQLRSAVQLLKAKCASDGTLAEALDSLGIVLAENGKEREAEDSYRQSIACYRQMGPAPVKLENGQISSIGYPLGNLAILLGHEGKFAESTASVREAYSTLQKIFPPDHPDVVFQELALAGSLVNENKPAEAEPLIRDALAKRAKVLGADHEETLIAGVELADDLLEQHRDKEAADAALTAAQALDRVSGPDNPYTLYAWSTFGNGACRSGRADAGLEALRRVEAGRTKAAGPGNWRTLGTSADVGACLVLLKRYAEAEPILLKAAKGLEDVRGPTFYRTQRA